MHHDNAIRQVEHLTKHGGARIGKEDRLYGVWKNMKTRCYRKNGDQYKYYGGRGITVCEEWRSSFKAFRDWAYANGYDPTAPRGKCTIDRIDNDGDYEPSNCRWVNSHIQRINQRQHTSESA